MTSITSATQSTLTQSGSAAYSSTTQVAASSPAPSTAASSPTISLSGRAIMLSRLFHTTDPNANPKIEYQTTTDNLTGSVYSFLNTQDRALVAKLYEYATAKGIDPFQVDHFAFDLGHYRMAPNENPCAFYDSEGNPVIPEFTPADEKIAQRLLTSRAMGDTAVDHGFLRAILTPMRQCVHATNFNFLQEVVFAFSATGSDGSADPNAAPVVRPKKEDFPKMAPVKHSQPGQEGYDIMMSRLFSVGGPNPEMEGDPVSRASIAGYLTETDRLMLATRYDKAAKLGRDLKQIDREAMKLAKQRFHEKLLADFLNQNQGKGKEADKNKRAGETKSSQKESDLKNAAATPTTLTVDKQGTTGHTPLHLPSFS